MVGKQLIRTITCQISLKDTPYVHSFLSFRESDHYVSLLSEISPEESMPQVFFVDGNGRWHPRQSGSAVAVGVKTGLPTVGLGTLRPHISPISWADESIVQRPAKEYLPIYLSVPETPLNDSSESTSYPRDYLLSQKGMRKACQVLLEKRGDWIGLPGPHESEEGTEAEYWGAVCSRSSL